MEKINNLLNQVQSLQKQVINELKNYLLEKYNLNNFESDEKSYIYFTVLDKKNNCIEFELRADKKTGCITNGSREYDTINQLIELLDCYNIKKGA